MFVTSAPIAMLGILIAPKKNVTAAGNGVFTRFRYEQHDPGNFLKWTAAVSAAVQSSKVAALLKRYAQAQAFTHSSPMRPHSPIFLR